MKKFGVLVKFDKKRLFDTLGLGFKIQIYFLWYVIMTRIYSSLVFLSMASQFSGKMKQRFDNFFDFLRKI
jgi:hypothetical protein